MFNSVLTKGLREQAGSETYNRFEYQVHWIVYHMVEEIKKGKSFFIFCEFHDDMAKCDECESPEKLEFFQIKTTSTKSEWKLNQLSSKTKNKKHSFIGFIFFNFMQFREECKSCHFVSNIDSNEEIRAWQAIIKDEEILKDKDSNLYNNIKNLIKCEFENIKDFDDIFDNFIQNTYIYNGGLPLIKYEEIVRALFLDLFVDKNVNVSNGKRIFFNILDEVRKKSKCKIKTPISFKELKEKKGISSRILKDTMDSFDTRKDIKGLFNDIEEYMKSKGKSLPYINLIIKKLAKHQKDMLDISNIYYVDTCNKIYEIIERIIEENFEKIDDIEFLSNLVNRECSVLIEDNTCLNKLLVEVMLYEKLLSN